MVVDMNSPTISRLRTEWQALGTAPPSSAACHRLAEIEPLVAHLEVNNLAELAAALSLSSGRLSSREAAAVIAAMLRGADADVLIPRAIIQALIPGVLALPQRVDTADGPWCDLDAFYADAISALWELTTSWSGTHRPYAAGDLLSAVRTRLRTLQATERRHRCRQTSSPDPLDTLPASIGRTGEELLAAALVDATGHGLTIADAAVLYATRVLGMSLAEVADIAEVPTGHLRRQRRNAIDRLVA
jgi:DNA-directed RNA polymerase specialized sigma24 family protein